MASSRGSSTPFSRPYPPVIVKKRPSPASVTPATVTATATAGSSRFSRAASPTMSSTAKATSARPISRQQSRVNLLSGTNSRKRARRDSDENSESHNAAAPIRPQRVVRQRLSSTSSMRSIKTLRSMSSVETLRGVLSQDAPTPRATEFVRPLSRQSSLSNLKRANSSMTSLANAVGQLDMPENSARARALRRVGNLTSSTASISTPEVKDVKVAAPTLSKGIDTSLQNLEAYASRIPLPTSRSSSMLSRARNLIARRPSLSRISTRPTRQLTPPPFSLDPKPEQVELVIDDRSPVASQDSVDSPVEVVGEEPEDRYLLQVSSRERHLELWDQPEDHVHAWAAYVSIYDRCGDASRFPLEDIDIRLSTHSYEGHEAPLYTTSHIGNNVRKKEIDALKSKFDPELGIVVATEWVANPKRPGQWFLKLWAPVPLSLFRDRDTRMFKLEAHARVLDDRTWARGIVHSDVVFDDVTHLRKEDFMDKRRARHTI